MIEKTGDDLLAWLMENPAANRLGWDQIPQDEQARLSAWHAAHLALGRQFPTRFSTVETPDGPRYFDWNDYPGKG